MIGQIIKKGVNEMPVVKIKEGETLKVQCVALRSNVKSSILSEIRKREHYEKPSVKK